jgi:hypothetical protein
MPFRAPAHLHFEGVFGPLQRPGIAQPQPFVGRLHLPAVANLLVEDAVLIANAVADRRNVQRGQRIHEARGQPPQSAVAQPRLLFLLDQHIQIDPQLPHRLLGLVVDPQVDQVVGQMRPGQKLRRKVADHPHILRLVVLHRLNPPLHQPVAHRVRQRHVKVVDRRPLGRAPLHKKQVVQKRLRQ